jgi:hypothetical protein
MPTPDVTPRSSTRPAALFALALVAALGLLAWRASARRSQRERPENLATNEVVLPVSDPLSLAPHGTRAALAVDLARLRADPSTAPLVARAAGAEGTCEHTLVSKVRRVLAFSRSADLGDLAFVFEGTLSRDEVFACARREREGRSRALVTERYRAVELVRSPSTRASELLPEADPAAIAALPGGVVLAGPSSAVRAMIDRAYASASATQGGDQSGLSPALRALTERLEQGYAIGAAGLVSARDPRWSSVLARVEGVAVGVYVTAGATRVTAVLACDDFDSPRSVADGLVAARADVLGQLRFAAVTRPLRDAQVERRATDVRVSLDVTADELSLIALGARALLEEGEAMLSRGLATPEDASVNERATDASAQGRDAR